MRRSSETGFQGFRRPFPFSALLLHHTAKERKPVSMFIKNSTQNIPASSFP
ncbi:hypothetical protein NEIMUCOT_04414 [Neisseria mucosa ATCC 25996]|uniref:Uncharacterized protein n=1 Tax=Neisseria mucosa (strain ATCC 25996 / DSM 4631 / NCTC 10774 / M26) TaxID=546266 RepID=D2ZUX3_NEIM2|nr:hypothetical protein NEIMUCOT_04414 [Neisseria mucosa ATCC 25996]